MPTERFLCLRLHPDLVGSCQHHLFLTAEVPAQAVVMKKGNWLEPQKEMIIVATRSSRFLEFITLALRLRGAHSLEVLVVIKKI